MKWFIVSFVFKVVKYNTVSSTFYTICEPRPYAAVACRRPPRPRGSPLFYAPPPTLFPLKIFWTRGGFAAVNHSFSLCVGAGVRTCARAFTTSVFLIINVIVVVILQLLIYYYCCCCTTGYYINISCGGPFRPPKGLRASSDGGRPASTTYRLVAVRNRSGRPAAARAAKAVDCLWRLAAATE